VDGGSLVKTSSSLPLTSSLEVVPLEFRRGVSVAHENGLRFERRVGAESG